MSEQSDVITDATETSDENSLRSTIEAAYENTPDEQAGAVSDETEAGIEQKTASGRDEHGRFVKKSAPAETVTTETVSTEQVVDPAAVVADPAAHEVAEPVKAPQAFSPAAKEIFDKLDPVTQGALQQELAKRENDVSKFIQHHGESSKRWQEISPAIEPWLPYLNSRNASPAVAFDALIRAEYGLQTGTQESKRAVLMQLAHDYGIEMGNQAPAPQMEQINPETGQAYDLSKDPRYTEVHTKLQNLETYIQKQEYDRQQETLRQQQENEAQSLRMVQEMAQNPAFPHFDALRETMQQLLEAGQAQDLEEAYEKAGWLVPEVRSTLITGLDAKRIKEKAEAALVAKGKKVSITGSPSGLEVKATPTTLRGTIEDAYEEASG